MGVAGLYVSVLSYNAVTYGKHSLRYLGPTLWSKLTTADRSVTLASFKNRIYLSVTLALS